MVMVVLLEEGMVMLGGVVVVEGSPETGEQSSVQTLSHKGPVKFGKQVSL